MKSFTINLKRSIARRKYVQDELDKAPFIDNVFIEGVDGKLLTKEDLAKFNQLSAQKRYGRALKLGEIGCTLSHRRCFKALLESEEAAVTIFEDDIIIRNSDKSIWKSLYSLLENKTEPTIILLSGGYWSHGKDKNNLSILVNVYSAYYTHSYMLNRAAAELMLSLSEDYLADDWRLFKHYGLKLYAVKPHLVDQQWDGTIPSMIQNEAKQWFRNLPIRYKIRSYLKMFPCKLLEILGWHESDSYDNFSQI